MFFKNRQEAGKKLSLLLTDYKRKDVIVYALPRGGVALAIEIARHLNAPLDLLFAHKIGHPYHPEYAIAAISESGYMEENSNELSMLGTAWIEKEKIHQLEEIKRKRKLYLKGKRALSPKGKIAILVDDGIATGMTICVAIKEIKQLHPKKIIIAAPIAPQSTANSLKKIADDFVGLEIPDAKFLGSVGAYYETFDQVEDEEVIQLMRAYSSGL